MRIFAGTHGAALTLPRLAQQCGTKSNIDWQEVKQLASLAYLKIAAWDSRSHTRVAQTKFMLMLLPDLGFKTTTAGAHASRTIMLAELGLLLDACSEDAIQPDYRQAVEDLNCLAKRSINTRALTWKHLVDLYGVNPDQLVFRAMRWFWAKDEPGRPLIALCAALARDGLLTTIAPHIWVAPIGATLSRESVEACITQQFPQRFSPATLKSVAQNINASLTQAGHLSGRASKRRQQATPSPGSVGYALLLGHASGARGPELFQTRFMKAQDAPLATCMALAEDAARKGWIEFKRIADVMEVAFPRQIRADEEAMLREQT